MTSREIMHLDDVRLARAKAMQSVQHALVAAVMAGSGYTSLSGGDTSHRWIAILELLAAAALFASIVLERWHHSRGSHARFGWIEIASGVLLFVEGLTKHHDGKWFHASYASGLIFVFLGVFEARFSRFRRRRRSLEATDEMLRVRLGPFRGFRIPWSEIAGARREAKRFTIERRAGPPLTVPLARVRNASPAAEWLESRLVERGIAVERIS